VVNARENVRSISSAEQRDPGGSICD